MRTLWLATMLLCSAALGACATPDGPRPDPRIMALERGQNAVEAGLEDAASASESVDAFVVRMRQNPCQCDAPPDEIYIHERWTRVYLDGDEAVLAALQAAESRAAERARLETQSVRGALLGKTRPSARGIAYPIFEVLALE